MIVGARFRRRNSIEIEPAPRNINHAYGNGNNWVGKIHNAAAGMNGINEYPYKHSAVINLNFELNCRTENQSAKGTPAKNEYTMDARVRKD